MGTVEALFHFMEASSVGSCKPLSCLEGTKAVCRGYLPAQAGALLEKGQCGLCTGKVCCMHLRGEQPVPSPVLVGAALLTQHSKAASHLSLFGRLSVFLRCLLQVSVACVMACCLDARWCADGFVCWQHRAVTPVELVMQTLPHVWHHFLQILLFVWGSWA